MARPAISNAEPEVNSEGFTTTVQPAARAKGAFWQRISAGKFQGVTSAATPAGSRFTRAILPGPRFV